MRDGLSNGSKDEKSYKTVIRTVKQYSSRPIDSEDFRELCGIAEDYQKLKRIVYERYGGIGGLSKISTRNVVQRELLDSGIRKELKLPSIYFQMAVKEAVSDIEAEWTLEKQRIQTVASNNPGLSGEEIHYLRFLLKVEQLFSAVNQRRAPELPERFKLVYGEISDGVDTQKLDNYIRRLTRKYHKRISAEKKDGFSLDRRGYKYDDHGIYVASREKRKRIFIPLTDNQHYDRQLRIKLKPEKNEIEIFVPINVRVRKNEVTGRRVGVSFGLYTMLVTDEGQEYGTEFGKYQNDYADWLRAEQKKYGRNMQDNPGRIKYLAKQSKKKERLRSYIGEELNRFLEEEKPSDIFIPKLPQIKPSGFNKVLNRRLSNWQRSFIINKLMQKCEQRDIRTYFVFGKGIGTTCSECGAVNEHRKQAQFICKVCGYQTSGQINSARNTLIRGIEAYEANNVH